MTTAIIERDFEGTRIVQRADGYWDATAMCKACGKLWGNYWRNKSTQEYMEELAASMRIRIDELVQSREGPPDLGGGTWVHRHVAIHLAQWLLPRFAVQVSIWIDELLTTGRVEVRPSSNESALLAMIAELRMELAEMRQLQYSAREQGLPLGIRERIRQVWPTATERWKAKILKRVKEESLRRGVMLWQPMPNGPYAVDQVQLPLVDSVILRMKEEAFNSYDMPLFDREPSRN